MNRVLVADPPWKFGDKLPGTGRGAEKHYPCMTVQEIARHPLPPMADDSLLFLWRVGAMQQEALTVAVAWGYVVKAEMVWLKTTKTGKRHFGMGRYVRAEHESCLVCVRGRVKVNDRAIRSTFSAPIGRHSEKPDEFFGVVERLSDGPYAEMFARKQRPGWSVFGDEVSAGAETIGYQHFELRGPW